MIDGTPTTAGQEGRPVGVLMCSSPFPGWAVQVERERERELFDQRWDGCGGDCK